MSPLRNFVSEMWFF